MWYIWKCHAQLMRGSSQPLIVVGVVVLPLCIYDLISNIHSKERHACIGDLPILTNSLYISYLINKNCTQLIVTATFNIISGNNHCYSFIYILVHCCFLSHVHRILTLALVHRDTAHTHTLTHGKVILIYYYVIVIVIVIVICGRNKRKTKQMKKKNIVLFPSKNEVYKLLCNSNSDNFIYIMTIVINL